MEQRAKAAGKKSAAAVYRKFINQMKKKTKKMNETIEAGQDLNALMKGIDADLKQRKKDLKKLPKKSVYERPLTKDEKKDKEKYVKGMKKSKG